MEQVYVQNTVHEILTGCMSSVHLTHVNKGRRGGGFRMVVKPAVYCMYTVNTLYVNLTHPDERWVRNTN